MHSTTPVSPPVRISTPSVRSATVPFRASPFCRILSVLILVGLWGLFGSAAAQPTPDVAAWTVPDSVTVGETFILNVTSSTPAHRAVGFPEADADPGVFGDLTVLGRSKAYSRRVGVGYAIDSVAYTVRTSAQGAVQVPSIPVWVDAGVDTVVAHTHPRTVWVSPRAMDPAASSPDASGEAEMFFWGAWAAVAALLIGGGRFLWTHVGEADASVAAATPAEAATSRTPYETAVARLDELQAAAPSSAGDRCVVCADVVRTYLARRLDVAAFTVTTDELLSRLDAHPEVSPAAHQHIEAVLRRADLVKFAGERPEAETVAESLSAARTALADIEHAAAPHGTAPE